MSAPAISRTPPLAGRSRSLPRSRRGATAELALAKPRLHWAVVLLLAVWLMPFVFSIGPVRMTPYRLTLLVLMGPCIAWVAQGRAGRARLPDILIVLFAIWCTISLVVIHGATGIQSAGIQVLETLTPYFLARCCIRTADDFYALARFLTIIVAALLPFAIYEAVTGHNLYVEIASRILPTIDITDKQPRWNLRRAQLFFDHPILTGVCLGSVLVLAHMVVGRSERFANRWLRSVVVGFTGALSLSSGPLSGMLAQILLMLWNWLFRWSRRRWMVLISLLVLLAVVAQLVAKRPLPNILLSFAFEPDSAFFRLLIWDFGTRSVANNPWFGVGMGEWVRPRWMGPSIDMFWLYNAITYGVMGGLLMFGFFLAAVSSIGAVKNLDQRHYDYRAAYLIAMVSFFLTGWMVHFWNGTYVFFILMVGSGMWLRDAPAEAPLVTGGQQLTTGRSLRRLDRKQRTVPRQARAGENLGPHT